MYVNVDNHCQTEMVVDIKSVSAGAHAGVAESLSDCAPTVVELSVTASSLLSFTFTALFTLCRFFGFVLLSQSFLVPLTFLGFAHWSN